MTPFVRLFAGTGTFEFLSPGILLAAAVTCLAASLYLLLPKSGRYGKNSRRVGWVLGLITLGLFIVTGQRLGNLGEEAVFLTVSLVAVISAAATITCRSPVYAAIWFALCLAGVSGVLLVLGAQFLGVATIVVYAGAILVMFLFVLMLAQPSGLTTSDRITNELFAFCCGGAAAARSFITFNWSAISRRTSLLSPSIQGSSPRRYFFRANTN